MAVTGAARTDRGYFVWEASMGGPLLLVAGGSGIVPVMAMLRHRAAAGSSVATRQLYSSRSFEDVIYRDELDRLIKSTTMLEVVQTLTRAQPPDEPAYASPSDGPGPPTWRLNAQPKHLQRTRRAPARCRSRALPIQQNCTGQSFSSFPAFFHGQSSNARSRTKAMSSSNVVIVFSSCRVPTGRSGDRTGRSSDSVARHARVQRRRREGRAVNR